ncbi:DUF3891 family protein [Pedobacter endophyticus]|uniref:DUF3891 family protein n=1 Tax=Pedobacter endophyticus TaxID=2789740 RepID=A0A7S9KY30_9SPHI|nr:DUF3891 family protein [Pedobacter endophyticus]QPH38935.1 DUF3891 family protein [Pedobacter endophyticus]
MKRCYPGGRSDRFWNFVMLFSLLICQSQIPPAGRRVEISSGPDGTSYFLHQKEAAIIVELWPFEAERFSVSYEIRTIKQLGFGSDEEFRSQLKASAVENNNQVISRA